MCDAGSRLLLLCLFVRVCLQVTSPAATEPPKKGETRRLRSINFMTGGNETASEQDSCKILLDELCHHFSFFLFSLFEKSAIFFTLIITKS